MLDSQTGETDDQHLTVLNGWGVIWARTYFVHCNACIWTTLAFTYLDTYNSRQAHISSGRVLKREFTSSTLICISIFPCLWFQTFYHTPAYCFNLKSVPFVCRHLFIIFLRTIVLFAYIPAVLSVQVSLHAFRLVGIDIHSLYRLTFWNQPFLDTRRLAVVV